MIIKNLQLVNFRNYSKLELDFTNQTTIFIGPNGAGKSNILEAIYLLSTSKSPRVDEEIELIKKGEEATNIKGIVDESRGNDELMITMVGDGEIKRFGKKVAINGVGKKVVDFIGNLPAVIFWPSDINLVTGSPSLRRWHLDLALAQLPSSEHSTISYESLRASISYKKALTLYEQILTNRNRVLKRINEGQGRRDELTYWTDELVKYGQVVSQLRTAYFIFINSFKNPLGKFQFEYHPNVLSYERLEQYKDREIAAMSTLIGPHRDDFALFLEGRDMSKFGSRGEQRMATLAFKLAQLEHMSDILKIRPVLLLDDVFSELDAPHRAVVAEISTKQQTVIATVELENIPQAFLDSARVLQVENGNIIH